MTTTQLVQQVRAKLHIESAQRHRQITHAKRIIAIGRCAKTGPIYYDGAHGDPLCQRWQDEGAPLCRPKWDGNYDVLPAEQREDWIGQ